MYAQRLYHIVVFVAVATYESFLCCSPKREARLLNIIQELKTYKKQLSAKIDETKRHVDFNVSPLHDILQNGIGCLFRQCIASWLYYTLPRSYFNNLTKQLLPLTTEHLFEGLYLYMWTHNVPTIFF